jgi:hypothetical protein
MQWHVFECKNSNLMMYYNCFKVLVTICYFTDKESIQILDKEQVFPFVEGNKID